jgi:hypothetical protein
MAISDAFEHQASAKCSQFRQTKLDYELLRDALVFSHSLGPKRPLDECIPAQTPSHSLTPKTHEILRGR